MTLPGLVGVLCVVAAYLVGAVPVGFLVVRWQRGIDIRQVGSGSSGTTNVYRAAGWKAAVVVFAADLLKVSLPVLVVRHLTASDLTASEWFAAAAGVAGLAGHCWPIYNGWSGGRGATGALGGIVVLQPIVALVCVVTAALVVLRTRYVSLGSLLGVGAGVIVMIYLIARGEVPQADIVLTIGAPSIIVIRHRDNIARLLKGTERKFGTGKSDVVAPTTS